MCSHAQNTLQRCSHKFSLLIFQGTNFVGGFGNVWKLNDEWGRVYVRYERPPTRRPGKCVEFVQKRRKSPELFPGLPETPQRGSRFGRCSSVPQSIGSVVTASTSRPFSATAPCQRKPKQNCEIFSLVLHFARNIILLVSSADVIHTPNHKILPALLF